MKRTDRGSWPDGKVGPADAPHPKLHVERRFDWVVAAWAARYRLTDAEVAILRAALAGTTREGMAAMRNVAPETLRSQVRRLLAKTGDARIADAVIRALLEIIERECADD